MLFRRNFSIEEDYGASDAELLVSESEIVTRYEARLNPLFHMI